MLSDDRYIALAWKHNVIHVYISQRSLYISTHVYSMAAETPYGVVKDQWVTKSSGVVDLVSGEEDGKLILSEC